MRPDFFKSNIRIKEFTAENIRSAFFKILDFRVLGGKIIGYGNSLEKNDLVSSFKIENGIIYGDTLDIDDNNIYSSSIDMDLLQYKNILMENINISNINLENILKVFNELKIDIIPENFNKLICKCNCNIEQPCQHIIALYFKFIDNIQINKDIIMELFALGFTTEEIKLHLEKKTNN